MTTQQLHPILPYLPKRNDKLVTPPDSDRELLDRFIRQGEEAAFAALVERHGPMVLRVCRRVVGNRHDAEDACQAAFLVLAQRAWSIRKKNSLGSWLHGVAFRVACALKKQIMRSKTREKPVTDVPAGDTLQEITWREAQVALDEELERLPERCRAPLVLCYLEGKTQDVAARQLGWSLGTLRGRLERGRSLLRSRLGRRGITLSGALLGSALAEKTAVAVVPLSLANRIIKAAIRTSIGQDSLRNIASARVASLTEGVSTPLVMNKMKFVLAILVAGTLAFGGALLGHRVLAGRDGDPEQPDALQPKEKEADDTGEMLPAHALVRLGSLRLRHGARVTSLAFTPDGKKLVTGSNDWRAVLWDVRTGKKQRDFTGLGGAITTVTFSPDGKTLAIGGDQKSQRIALWNVEKGKRLHELKGHKASILALAFSPRGDRLASASADGTVRVWETATGKEQGKPLALKGNLVGVRFSATLKRLAVITLERNAGGGPFTGLGHLSLTIEDAETGKSLGKSIGLPGTTVALSADFTRLASTSPGEITLRETATARKIRTLHTEKTNTTALAFTPDNKALLAGDNNGKVRLFDLATGRTLCAYQGHTDLVKALALSPDGKIIASAGYDNVVHLANAATGKELLPQPGHRNQIHDVACSPDGTRVATASMDRSIILWDAVTPRELHRFLGHSASVRAIALSADGKTLVSASDDGTVRVWDTRVGKDLSKITAHSGGAWAIALSPDGKQILSGGGDGIVRLWETSTGKPVRYMWIMPGIAGNIPPRRIAGASVPAVAFAPGGDTVAAITGVTKADGPGHEYLAVWDAASGEERWRWHDRKMRQFTALTYAPDGRTLAAVARNGEVHVWETETGLLRTTFSVAPTPLLDLQFSRDGRLLGIGCNEGIVQLCEVATGKVVHTLEGHLGWVRGVAFSADGKRLATASGDTTALVWDVSGFGQAKAVPLTAKEAEALWDDLAEKKDGARIHRAIARLSAAPKQSLMLLKKHLHPAKPLSAEQHKRIAQLIAELNADDFQTREQATVELAKLGQAAGPALREAAKDPPSFEVQVRINQLLQKLDGVKTRTLSPEQVRLLRGLEVLERLDTPEAHAFVARLARGGSADWLTEEAQRMQQRLKQRER
jgi:RNA polymerase sigma factor (sigma-70 family)